MSTPMYVCDACGKRYDSYYLWAECCDDGIKYTKQVDEKKADLKLAKQKRAWYENTKKQKGD